MEEKMYLLAQYLAATGISFLPKKDDDSHTNLTFSIENESLYSGPLNKNGDTLSVSYKKFELHWNSNNVSVPLRLEGVSHSEILEWIERMATKAGLRSPYKYSFHYEFPYEIDDNYIFRLLDTQRLRELLKLRISAQLILEKFLKDHGLTSEIRIWPHHFDTGAYANFNDNSGRAVGLGLAVPDSICSDHYFYISGYQGNDEVNILEFKPLSHGNWGVNGFNGAILPATGVDKNAGVSFFSEAFSHYQN